MNLPPAKTMRAIHRTRSVEEKPAGEKYQSPAGAKSMIFIGASPQTATPRITSRASIRLWSREEREGREEGRGGGVVILTGEHAWSGARARGKCAGRGQFADPRGCGFGGGREKRERGATLLPSSVFRRTGRKKKKPLPACQGKGLYSRGRKKHSENN